MNNEVVAADPGKDEIEQALDKFEKDGKIRVRFGDMGVYTITDGKMDGGRGYLHGPVVLWWKGNTPEENRSNIILNSRKSYYLPSTEENGQALQLNLAASFFQGYGKTASRRAAAASYLNYIFSGVAVHKVGCGYLYSEIAHNYRRNVEIEVL